MNQGIVVNNKSSRSGLIDEINSCHDKCHDITCKLKCKHGKLFCDYNDKYCTIFEQVDCIKLSIIINEIMNDAPCTYENFDKFHYQCRSKEYCEGRNSLKFFSETCGCKYNSYAKTCFDDSCHYYPNHDDNCKYYQCHLYLNADCDCSYNKKSYSCFGNRCRNEEHKGHCEYEDCTACFGS